MDQYLNFDKAGFKKYFKNTSWLFIARIIVLGISFLTGIYIARYLGPEKYGLLNYVMGFSGLFSFIAGLGIDSILSRELIHKENQKNEYLGTALALKILGATLSIIVIGTSLTFIQNDLYTKSLILLFSISFIFQSFGVVESFFQSKVLAKYTATAQLSSYIISAAIKIVLVLYHASLTYFVFSYLLDTIVASLGLLIAYRLNKQKISDWRVNWKLAKEILHDSWPLMLVGLSMVIYSRIDQVLIKNMIDNQSAGVYAIAVKLSEVWYFIPGIIAGSILPSAINAKKIGTAFYQKRLMYLYSLLFWISVAIALPISLLAKPIISLLFGSAYIAGATSLSIYVWAGVGVFVGIAVGQYLVIENFTKINFITTFLGMITNVSLNLYLIPRYGINGSAFATLISYNLSTFSIIFFKKTRGQIKLIVKSIFFKFN